MRVHDNFADTNNSALACAVSQKPTPTCSWWNNTVVDASRGGAWPAGARAIMAAAGARGGLGGVC